MGFWREFERSIRNRPYKFTDYAAIREAAEKPETRGSE